MNDQITILIADDHPIFRRGLRQIIETEADLTIVGEASDGEEALTAIRDLNPAVAVLDVDMPKRDGLELARLVKTENLATAVIILTMYKEERFFNAALDAGVMGYVIKDSAINEISAAVRAAAAGQNFISPTLSTLLVNRLNRAENTGPAAAADSLTAAERRVLKLVAEYKTNKQIADELCVSVRTVEAHRAHICNKLDITGSHALLQFALKELKG
jgi:DNA-binding NarL/FixJ family response regulator